MKTPPQLTIQDFHDVRAQGAELQFLAPSGWRDTNNAPDGNDDPERWRVKPGPVPPTLEDEEESCQGFEAALVSAPYPYSAAKWGADGLPAAPMRVPGDYASGITQMAWHIWESCRKRAIELCKAHHSNEP